MTSSFHPALKLAELDGGAIVPVTVAGAEIVVYKVGDQVCAAQRRCPHHGADLADGLVSRGLLICANHGWQFDAVTGRHVMSPETCLRTYRVRLERDEVEVDPTPIWRGEVPA